VISDIHDTLTEAAHAGYHRTYNQLATTYHWPYMLRQLKQYTLTCDTCQKSKPWRHAPMGLLQPIPIPTQPFEVVLMDFIPELPNLSGFNNILVIVDKLTKYSIFIPCKTDIMELETTQLFFKHIITHFGIPKQVITDRNMRWRHNFWAEICCLLGMKRALTMAYHPQADGQTENLNQMLEIALQAYIGPSWFSRRFSIGLQFNSLLESGKHSGLSQQ
jgi:hypothetical protein